MHKSEWVKTAFKGGGEKNCREIIQRKKIKANYIVNFKCYVYSQFHKKTQRRRATMLTKKKIYVFLLGKINKNYENQLFCGDVLEKFRRTRRRAENILCVLHNDDELLTS